MFTLKSRVVKMHGSREFFFKSLNSFFLSQIFFWFDNNNNNNMSSGHKHHRVNIRDADNRSAKMKKMQKLVRVHPTQLRTEGEKVLSALVCEWQKQIVYDREAEREIRENLVALLLMLLVNNVSVKGLAQLVTILTAHFERSTRSQNSTLLSSFNAYLEYLLALKYARKERDVSISEPLVSDSINNSAVGESHLESARLEKAMERLNLFESNNTSAGALSLINVKLSEEQMSSIEKAEREGDEILENKLKKKIENKQREFDETKDVLDSESAEILLSAISELKGKLTAWREQRANTNPRVYEEIVEALIENTRLVPPETTEEEMRTIASKENVVVERLTAYTVDSLDQMNSTGKIDSNYLKEMLHGFHRKEGTQSLLIVDCRNPYEYRGGHIYGAINVKNFRDVEETFFTPEALDKYGNGKYVLVFHCQFSSIRGPECKATLKSIDRELTLKKGPNASSFYPDVFLLQGGYDEFFKIFNGAYCTPPNYVKESDYKAARSLYKKIYKELSSQERRRGQSEPILRTQGPSAPRPVAPSRPNPKSKYVSVFKGRPGEGGRKPPVSRSLMPNETKSEPLMRFSGKEKEGKDYKQRENPFLNRATGNEKSRKRMNFGDSDEDADESVTFAPLKRKRKIFHDAASEDEDDLFNDDLSTPTKINTTGDRSTISTTTDSPAKKSKRSIK